MYRSIRRILTVSCVTLGVASLVPATQTSYGQGGGNGNLALPWPGFPFANGGFRVGMPRPAIIPPAGNVNVFGGGAGIQGQNQ